MTTEGYREKIDRLITASTGDVVLNGTHDHAAIVLERMFARADKCVKILSEKIDPRIYSEPRTLEAAKRMLGARDRTIQVLVEDLEATPVSRNPFFALADEASNLEIRQVPKNLRGPVAINFSLMDDRGYRFEKDQTGATAIVAFGEKDLTPRLRAVFERVWALSKPLELEAA